MMVFLTANIIYLLILVLSQPYMGFKINLSPLALFSSCLPAVIGAPPPVILYILLYLSEQVSPFLGHFGEYPEKFTTNTKLDVPETRDPNNCVKGIFFNWASLNKFDFQLTEQRCWSLYL